MSNGLEPIKPLATKLQKWNQYVYQAFILVGNAIHNSEDTGEEIDKQFATWFEFAKEMA